MTEMVHIEGDNGPGWMVPRRRPWAEMSESEQLKEILRQHDISCPGWCAEDAQWNSAPGVFIVAHLFDLDYEVDPFAMGLEQRDYLSLPDGDLIRRDPVEVSLLVDLDDAPEMHAVVERNSGQESDNDRFGMDPADAAQLAEKLRGEPYEWAPRMADGLEKLVKAADQPRRANGIEWYYGRGPD